MDVLRRNNVHVSGRPDGPPLVFAHGFGCDQHMWRLVAPAFEATHKVVVFDHVGAGASDLAAYDPVRYASLDAYADDVLAVLAALDLHGVTFVGHSVSAMIGVLAAIAAPERFASLVLLGPSPRYIDDDGYVGGFAARDIEELLEALAANHLGWSATMAPVIMGNPDRPELAEELESSFCRTDPAIAEQFARVTFLSDNRADLPRVRTPTLVVQSAEDAIAPPVVGEYVHRHVAGSRLVVVPTSGHCPHLSAPAETIAVIREFCAAEAA